MPKLKPETRNHFSITVSFDDKVSFMSVVYKSDNETNEEAEKNATDKARELVKLLKGYNPTFVRISDLTNYNNILSKKL